MPTTSTNLSVFDTHFVHSIFANCVYICIIVVLIHDDTIKWKYLPRYWPLWGESIGHRWIPLTKASDADLRCFDLRLNKRLSKQWRRRWFETRRAHYNVTVMFIIICFMDDKNDGCDGDNDDDKNNDDDDDNDDDHNWFSWMKMYESRFKFHWSLFPMVRLTIFQHWFIYWLGADKATSHYLSQCWFEYGRIYA